MRTRYTLVEVQYDDDLIVSDLDDGFDVILDLRWLIMYDQQLISRRRTEEIPAALCHLKNASSTTSV